MVNKRDNKENKTQTITEIKCKCLECGKIWHYLESEERSMQIQGTGNAMLGCSMCCSPVGAYYSNKSTEIQREAKDRFSKCPSCQSSNIKKEKRTIERSDDD